MLTYWHLHFFSGQNSGKRIAKTMSEGVSELSADEAAVTAGSMPRLHAGRQNEFVYTFLSEYYATSYMQYFYGRLSHLYETV